MRTEFYGKVAVVVVNWNGKADTLECLEALRRDNFENKSVIVVDNHSSDGSVETIRAEFPDTQVVQAGANLGFAGGNNIGIRSALETACEFILLLNNDTVIAFDAISHLVKAAHKHPEVAIFSPVIYHFDPKDKVWFSGSSIDLRRGEAVHDNKRSPEPEEGAYEVPWLSGCAMLVRRSTLEAIRGFDERFFLYWEDVDLCLRAQAIGARLAIAPAARIHHKIGRSCSTLAAGAEYYYLRNNLLLVKLHAGKHRSKAEYCILRAAVKRCLEWPERRKRTMAAFRAVRDHISGRYGRANHASR